MTPCFILPGPQELLQRPGHRRERDCGGPPLPAVLHRAEEGANQGGEGVHAEALQVGDVRQEGIQVRGGDHIQYMQSD